VTVSLSKRLRNGRFTSETATWIQKRFKTSAKVFQGKPPDLDDEVPWEWDVELGQCQFKTPTPERPLHNSFTRTGCFVRWVMAVKRSRYKFVTKQNRHLDPEGV
jgi:hypothetical protein